MRYTRDDSSGFPRCRSPTNMRIHTISCIRPTCATGRLSRHCDDGCTTSSTCRARACIRPCQSDVRKREHTDTERQIDLGDHLAIGVARDYVRVMTQPAVFHPAVEAWFRKTFPVPTEAQARAWPAIQAGSHVLVAAPTGSGKTLAAFLAAIDALVRRGGGSALPDGTAVVYGFPLQAPSNDIPRNL